MKPSFHDEAGMTAAEAGTDTAVSRFHFPATGSQFQSGLDWNSDRKVGPSTGARLPLVSAMVAGRCILFVAGKSQSGCGFQGD